MKFFPALFTGVLFLLPSLAAAQTAASPASPAPTASPAPLDTPTITVPDGWTAKDYTMNMGGFTLIKLWYAPGGTTDNINLGFSPNPTGADISAVVPQMRAALTKMLGAANLSDHAEKVCNGSVDGWLFHGKMDMGQYHMIVDEAVLASKHDVFGATYTRLSDHPDDPAAHKALDSLCAKS